MDKETEKYYNSLQDVFVMEGWKELMKELSANALNINTVEATRDNDDLNFRKGQLNILAFILNLESTVDHLQKEGSDEDRICPECGETSSKIISATKTVLDPISGSFPGATMKWARDREQKIKRERKVANS